MKKNKKNFFRCGYPYVIMNDSVKNDETTEGTRNLEKLCGQLIFGDSGVYFRGKERKGISK